MRYFSITDTKAVTKIMTIPETKLKAFHGQQEVKDEYIARIKKHQKLDNLVQNYGYWDGGRGCAVGCTLEVNADPHEQYPIELGLPIWLAHMEDHLFETLPLEDAKQWPLQFLEAIPVGAEVGQAMSDRFQIFWLERQKTQIDCKRYSSVEGAINDVIKLLNQALEGDEPNSAAWSAARSAARSAANSAALSASLSAAWSESSASSAAWSARSAAWSAVWSAERSANSATESASESEANSAANSVARSEAQVKRDWILTELKALK